MTAKQFRGGCWFFFGLNAVAGIAVTSLGNLALAVAILFYLVLLYNEKEGMKDE